MQYDRITLSRQAKELGFVRDTFEKVCRLADTLSFIGQDSLLGNALALKGGTAINLTIFSLPRLSVDIDLDLAKNVSRSEMEKLRPQILDRIHKYMMASGYILSAKSRKSHALDSSVYEYTNAGNMKDNIKIEINYINRAHVLPASWREVKLPWQQNSGMVLTLDPIEIFASKIVALMSRAAPRDLYDVHLMQKNNLFDESDIPLLRKCVMLYSAIGTDVVPENISFDAAQELVQNQIKTDLAPVLHQGEYFDLDAARKTLIPYLESMLVPQEKELTFWREFQQKRYSPELLFDDPDIISRIAKHPMAIWKCEKQEKQEQQEKPSLLAELHRIEKERKRDNPVSKPKNKKNDLER